MEEVYTNAARGLTATAQWTELDLLYSKFVDLWPRSDHRPRMDYYNTVSQYKQGKVDSALRTFRQMAGSDLYEDVKADAAYQLGLHYANSNPPNLPEAHKFLWQSVRTFTKEYACFALAKVCMKLRKWEEARELLERTTREFPQGDPYYAQEAEKLLPEVQKEIAKAKSTK
jgi:tetratricopeptide (TPR) repeat protein